MTRSDEPPTHDGSSAADDPSTTGVSRELDTDVSADRFEALSGRLRERLSSRREFLSDSAKVGGGALALASAGSGVAAAQNGGQDHGDLDAQVDQPEGFSADVVAPHATFPDDVAAALFVDFEDGEAETAVVRDASTVVIAEVRWEPGGTTGWHTHPGPVIVNVVEGEIDVIFADDCITHTYAAGEAFVDTGGHAEIAENTSDTEQAAAYAIFLGVPDGEPPTNWVEPQDC